MKIKNATIDELSFVVNLLNKTTISLHHKGIMQWNYPCDENPIKNDIKKGFVKLFIYDNEIIGTFSIKPSECSGVKLIKNNNLYLYRIALLPEYQGKKIGLIIIDYSIEYAKQSNKILYLDCWSGNTKLINFYSNVGFKIIGHENIEDFSITVFEKNILP